MATQMHFGDIGDLPQTEIVEEWICLIETENAGKQQLCQFILESPALYFQVRLMDTKTNSVS